ncbi:hypothetical protein PR003_g14937 [Phytophthora rubi]|uniref:Secreted protein n=1 Tax=Phytophthora rubi TaxID=129364 RepID=A0A6A3JVM1_9STRA|nr:hypothetical protein PR001_g19620 [Phytophthora rubi]KAE9331590.1 hypothetical protein PR003_g14937 [Phytophthora rubi]
MSCTLDLFFLLSWTQQSYSGYGDSLPGSGAAASFSGALKRKTRAPPVLKRLMTYRPMVSGLRTWQGTARPRTRTNQGSSVLSRRLPAA